MKSTAIAIAGALLGSTVVSIPAVAVPGISEPQTQSVHVLEQPEALPRPAVNARSAATFHIWRHRADWGLTGADLQFVDVTIGVGGARTVRFTQSIAGIPVLGSLVSVTVDSAGSLMSSSISLNATPEASGPTLSQSQAKNSIRAAGYSHVSNQTLVIADHLSLNELSDGSWFVWKANATAPQGAAVTVYLRDADSTIIAARSRTRNVVDTTPLICDRTGLAAININVEASVPLCDSAHSIAGTTPADAITALDLSRVSTGIERTRSYYQSYLSTNRSAGLGMDISSEDYDGNIAPAVNYAYSYGSAPLLANAQGCKPVGLPAITNGVCSPRLNVMLNVCETGATCPNYPNAFWFAWTSNTCASTACGALFFGRGWGADDVVAHELTHGVSDPSAFMDMSSNETNALAEAYSDFIGEAVDQLTVDPGEVADPRWSFGEDVGKDSSFVPLVGWTGRTGPFRTMAGVLPGEYQSIGSSWNANEDPHYNLGPADRLAYLLANGGKQSGVTVKALGTQPWTSGDKDGLCDSADECTGTIRMTQLVMQALPKLPLRATYFQFGQALTAACSDLRTLAVPGFSKTSCGYVRNALSVTKISRLAFGSATKAGTGAAGRVVAIKARLKTSTGAWAPGVRVQLQVRSSTRAKWRTVARRYTDGNSYARFSLKVNAKTYYRIATVSSSLVPSAATGARLAKVG